MREPDYWELETNPLLREQEEQEEALEESRIESLHHTPHSFSPPPLLYSRSKQHRFDDDDGE